MGIRATILAWLKTVAAVTTIVGGGDDARIFPYAAPEGVEGGADAFVVYRRSDAVDGRQLTQQGNVKQAEFEFACASRSAVDAEALADAIADAVQSAIKLHDGGLNIRSATHVGEVDGFYDLADGSSDVGYLTTVTIRFTYKLGG